MSKEIKNLNPALVWKNFYSLTQIPRPSKSEAAVIAFAKKFGEDLGLETIVDETGNVIIRKPATPGMEDRKGVIMQGHLDMVPQKSADSTHDFIKDPIDAYVDGDWVTARGTTLGADNGMGVAAAMAVLESKDLVHGPVEALFTTDEETGMTGAFGLKPGVLKGDILLNMDSESEGELYIGCAGGIDANIEMCYSEEAVPANQIAYKISVSGLKGGHSGMDIILGLGNANKIINRVLYSGQKELAIRLASIDGGGLRNAIPRDASAIITVAADKAGDFESLVTDFNATIKAELALKEAGVSVTAEKAEMPASVMDTTSQTNLIKAVYGCPNGVIRMSDAMENLVETSNNLARVVSNNGVISIQSLLRSSVDSAKDDLTYMIESVFTLAGAKVVFEGAYPGWAPNPSSPILKEMQEVYLKMYGRTPEIMAIHAGLECGLLGAVYPNWDMISFGPTIRSPHSPDERVHIESVAKFWDYTVEILKNIPKK